MMNARRLLFVTEYIKNGGNAEKAALAAGYSKKFAYHKAYSLLREEAISTLLARAGKRIEQQSVMDGAAVTRGLAEIAMADVTTFMRRDVDGNYVGRAPHELTPEQRRVIKAINVREVYGPKDDTGNRPVIGQRFKYEVHDKFSALMALAKVYGTFVDDKPKAPSITLNMFAEMSEEDLAKLQTTMQAAIEGQFTRTEETANGALLSHD